ncbi:MAG: hypothetical protein M1379_05255 [Firmicutes bacterium]|nr:hypothetical protein [Bacillota bacterium]
MVQSIAMIHYQLINDFDGKDRAETYLELAIELILGGSFDYYERLKASYAQNVLKYVPIGLGAFIYSSPSLSRKSLV